MEVLTTIASVPAIMALVKLFGDLGVPNKFKPIMAVAFGVGVEIASTFSQEYVYVDWFTIISTGVILGLSAAGIYDASSTIGGAKAAKQANDTNQS